MLKYSFLLFILFCLVCCTDDTSSTIEEDDNDIPFFPENVLFIGNSHTKYNQGIGYHLSQFVDKGALPYKSQISINAVGGYTLEDHFNDPKTLDRIKERDWDIIIFQENTLVSHSDKDKMKAAVKNLLLTVKNPRTKIYLFMTWAYEDDQDMINNIKNSYEETANASNAQTVPVGIAFHEINTSNNYLGSLYHTDGIHPSLEGTFLASAMFYFALYNRDPRQNPYIASLDEEIAEYLKEVGHRVTKNYQTN